MAGLLSSLILLMAAIPVNAQAAEESAPRRAGMLAYDRAHEITVDGTIEKVLAKAVPGTPGGMHIVVTGPKGTLDAHLGPYLNKETKKALEAGTPVQMVGAMERLKNGNILLVRQLIFSGRQVTVRSANGFLIHPRTPGASRPTAVKISQAEVSGGAR